MQVLPELPYAKDRLRSNSQDHVMNSKRMRTGSISGRLRTASDLEQMGFIDQSQKGIIKDMIISGNSRLLELLDTFELSKTEELLALIKSECAGDRKHSIDILDGLDFDFINHMRSFSEALSDDFAWPNTGTTASSTGELHVIPPHTHTHTVTHTHSHPSSMSMLAEFPYDLPAPPSSAGTAVTAGTGVNNGIVPPVSMHMSALPVPPLPLSVSMSTAVSAAGKHVVTPSAAGAGLEDVFEHNRRGSIDALLTSALMDDSDNLMAHVAVADGEDHNVHELDFHSIFDHFPEHVVDNNNSNINNNKSGYSPRSGEKQRKSLRLTLSAAGNNNNNNTGSALTSGNHHFGESNHHDLSADKVDLSAYASHAASLQQQNLDKKYNTIPSTTSYRIKTEPKSTSGGHHKSGSALKPTDSLSTIKSPYIVSPYMTTLPSTTSSAAANSSSDLLGLSSLGYSGSSSSATANLYSMESLLPPSSLMSDLHGQTSGVTGSNTTLNGAPRMAGYIGAYSPEQRKLRIEKFLEKRSRRVWTRKVKYDVRKNFADSRLRIKGRFVKKEDEDIMRELLSI